MSILAWIFLGGIAGWIASMIMGTDASQGILMNIVVGIIGAIMGGVIFSMFGTPGVTGFNLYSLIVAVVGAALFIWIVRMIRA
ncbi:MAG: GlsB/YeaQ/YmgE family stress response membrane protein [Patescibacteria group bacterium]